MFATIALAGQDISTFIIMVVMVVILVLFFVFSSRSQKKQERQQNDMRNNLQIGDEVTTIGGIIGKVVSIREETFVLETSHDRTHIRFLKTAISRIDVKADEADK